MVQPGRPAYRYLMRPSIFREDFTPSASPSSQSRGRRASLLEAGVPGAKREPDRAKPQLVVSWAKSKRCRSDAPRLRRYGGFATFFSDAATPLRGGEYSNPLSASRRRGGQGSKRQYSRWLPGRITPP